MFAMLWAPQMEFPSIVLRWSLIGKYLKKKLQINFETICVVKYFLFFMLFLTSAPRNAIKSSDLWYIQTVMLINRHDVHCDGLPISP